MKGWQTNKRQVSKSFGELAHLAKFAHRLRGRSELISGFNRITVYIPEKVIDEARYKSRYAARPEARNEADMDMFW